MKPYLKLLLCGFGVLCIAAAGNQYFQVLPGLQIKHPITGAITATINGTNGTVTAGYFVGDGSGLTGLPSGSSIVGTLVTNGTSITAGDLLMAGSRLTNVVSAGAPIWTNLPLLTDMEGGTVYGSISLNSITNGVFQFQANNLPSFRGDISSLISIGYPVQDPRLAIGNAAIFSYGDFAGYQQQLTNCATIFNYGDYAGNQQNLTNSDNIYNYGNHVGDKQIATNSYAIYNYGDGSGNQQFLDNCNNIYNYGSYAGDAQALTTSEYIFNYGSSAGAQMVSTNTDDIYNIGSNANIGQVFNAQTHMFALGSFSKTTNSNDFVFGDNAYNYFFPGASARFDNSVTSAGTVSANAVVVTNALTAQTINVSTNNGGTLVVSNMVANTTPVFDANIVMQPSRTPTNALDSIRSYGTNWAVGDLGAGVYLGERKYCTNVLTPWGSGDWVEWNGTNWYTLRTRILAAETLPQYMFNQLVAKWKGDTDISAGRLMNAGFTTSGSSGVPIDGWGCVVSSGDVTQGASDGRQWATMTTLASSSASVDFYNFSWKPTAGDIAIASATVYLPDLSTDAETYRLDFGFGSGYTSIGNDAAVLHYDRTNVLNYLGAGYDTNIWWGITRVGGATTTNLLSAVTVTEDAWHTLTILKTTTYDSFYVDGSMIASNTTVTAASLVSGKLVLKKYLGSTARTCQIGSLYLGVRHATPVAIYP